MESLICIRPKLLSICTNVHIGKGLIKSKKLPEIVGKSKSIVIADEAIKELYGRGLAQQLKADLIAIPSGEKAKSLEIVSYLLERLSELRAAKDTTVIALGGGTTTDLAGFAASIYLRGVPLILMPTTLLGAVDAAIGGKTAINSPFGKNQIGTTYHPKAVVVDLDTFETLPEKEKLNGLAEILKMGLIQDASIFDLTEGVTPQLIMKAMKAKIAIVEEDPSEQGIRRILNFGHTIAHGLEAVSDYSMPHGKAVALGCLVESYLSMQLNDLKKEDFEKIQETYSCFSLKLPENYSRRQLIEAMHRDKKNTEGKIRFVLLETIGRAASFHQEYCRSVSELKLQAALDWMEAGYS